MKCFFFIATFLCFSHLGYSQFSATAKYSFNNYPVWEDLVSQYGPSESDFLNNNFEYGLAYWFRLKNKRIEFYPEINYQSVEGTTGAFIESDNRYSLTSFHFQFNAQIYTMDLDGDCNCPTFSKDGDLISKGFFVGISPGVGYYQMNIKAGVFPENGVDRTAVAPRIGVYTGIDIGITDLITITPIAHLNYTIGVDWDGFVAESWGLQPNPIEKSNILAFQPGLRITIRPDYLKEQGRW